MKILALIGSLRAASFSKKIAEAALTGPHSEVAKTRIARLRTPELKALAAAGE